MRGIRRALAIVGLLATTRSGRAEPPAEPFAMLRDRAAAWDLEVVRGPTPGALAAVPGAPAARCSIAAVVRMGIRVRSDLRCTAVSAPGARPPEPALAAVLEQARVLMFDDAGVREIRPGTRSSNELIDPTNALGFTFPRVLDGTWTHEAGRGDQRVRVVVRSQPLTLGDGSTHSVWLARHERAPATRGAPEVHELTAVAPGDGPVLLCSPGPVAAAHRPADLWCLRRYSLATSVVPAPSEPAPAAVRPASPPPPSGWMSITRATAHDRSSLSPAALASKLKSAYMTGLRRCYKDLLRKQPSAKGTLEIRLTVTAVGRASDVRITSFHEALTACAVAQSAGWRFPIPLSEYAEPRNASYTVALQLVP